ncbi:MAG: 4'-phosphopantetheinyl transferase superfamily protein [Henriciella sp.]|nr:4'-phosphopantetheinyl transferase superfamily protein [Henriciella sp.]
MTPASENSEVSVEIWLWDNADYVGEADHLFTLLNDEELARRDRQFSRQKGTFWAISRARVRERLASITGKTAVDLQFEENEYGKLRLPGANLHFSLSHEGSWTALAICEQAEIGLDLEAVKPLSREEMDWPLSPVERQHLSEVASEDIPQAFFRYWTLKEAFIKGLGLGVSFPLEDFDMTPFGEAPGLLRVHGDPEAAKNWVFEAHEIRPGLRFAVGVKSGGKELKLAYHAKT